MFCIQQYAGFLLPLVCLSVCCIFCLEYTMQEGNGVVCSLEELRLERLGSAEHLRTVQRSFEHDIARRVLAAEVPRFPSAFPRSHAASRRAEITATAQQTGGLRPSLGLDR